MSDALWAVVLLVTAIEDADTLDNVAARGFLADMAKAENAIALSKICLHIALSHDQTLLH